jgi:hypothetical protein
MSARRPEKKQKIDTIEKLAGLVVESMEDLRSEMSRRFDGIGDQLLSLWSTYSGITVPPLRRGGLAQPAAGSKNSYPALIAHDIVSFY